MKINLNGWKMGALVLLIAIVGLTAGCAQTKSETIATVNGEKITREELADRLIKQSGKEVLDQMITEKLIAQEAKKKGISITEAEINKKIEEVKKQFPDEKTFQSQLKANNLTLENLKEQIKLQLIIEKVLKGKVKVTEKEIKSYYDENKNTFFKGKKFDEVKDQIKEELEYQSLSFQAQSLIEGLKKKAKIVNNLEKK